MSGVELQQKIEAAIRESLERTVGSLRDEVSRRLRHSQDDVLGYLTTVDIRAAVPVLPAELLSPPAPPAPDSSVETLAALEAGLRAIDGSRSQAAVLRALLVSSSRHSSRAAVFLMTKEGARLWESQGFARAPLPASLGAGELAGLNAIRSGGGPETLDGPTCRQLAHRLGVDAAASGVLIPLVLRDQVAAALYADRLQGAGTLEVSALQMLAYVAALSIETLGFRRRDATPTLTPIGQASTAHLEPWSGGQDEKPAPALTPPPPAPVAAPVATAPQPVRPPQATSQVAEASLLWADELAAKPSGPTPAPPATPAPAGPTSFTAADWWTRFPEASKEPEPPPAPAPSKPLGPLAPAAEPVAAAPVTPEAPLAPVAAEPPTPVAKPPVFEAPSFDDSLPSVGEHFGTVRIPRASELFANVREGKPTLRPDEVVPSIAEPSPVTSAPMEPPGPATAAIPIEALSAPAWEEDIPPSPTERRVDLSTANLDVSEDETLMLPGRSTAAAPGGGIAPTTPIPAAPQPTVPAMAVLNPRLPPEMPVSAATQRIPTAGLGSAKPPTGGSTAELPRPRSSSSEVVPPENLRGPGLAFAGARASDTPANDEARRLARLLVSEIKLYNEEQVDQGRKNLDLYQRLREDIDRSRQMYEERVDPSVRSTADYFQQELIRILAAGDPKALGA